MRGRLKAFRVIDTVWLRIENAWCRIGEVDVVGVDISGRHEEAGEYLMVAAAVAASVGSNRIEGISGMGFGTSRQSPTLDHTVAIIREAIGDLPHPPSGPIVAEHGEFYEEPVDTMGIRLGTDFKYVESIAERKTVDAAHHAAYAARNLML